MRKRLIVPLLVVLCGAVTSAQLVITSLNQNGDLTWTNVVSNATYGVEYASSVSGPWGGFDAWPNLNSILATNNSVTVKVPLSSQVPLFYRVGWRDAPPFAGTWNYSAFDTGSTLLATGRLYFSPVGSVNSSDITGTWAIQLVANTTNILGSQIGSGQLAGGTDGSNLTLSLNPRVSDANAFLKGVRIGNTYTGMWGYSDFITLRGHGNFQAVKE